MPATKSILSATKTNNDAVFSAFKTHCAAPRVDTKTTALTLIRRDYPDHHVTEVEERTASLFDFASAGHAELTLDAEEEAFCATREWEAVGEGVEKVEHAGKLKDEYRFARFQYIWNNSEYLIYFIQWEDIFKAPDRTFYILFPRSPSPSHCPTTDALILAAAKWTSQLHSEIFVFDDGQWEKSKQLWTSVRAASWTDVILPPAMKSSLISDVLGFFDNRDVYARYNVPWKRGIILHGVPGNGKTASIKALMNALYNRTSPVPALYVKSFETNCQTEQYAIRSIFQQARSTAPCLLVFEDLDSLVKDGIRSYFLNEVDGLESNDGILMIGSTNHLARLDPAISKRPSRFDRKYHFKIPGEGERRAYVEFWREKVGMLEEFTDEVVGIVVRLTEGFSFAYLKEVFVMVVLRLVRGGEDEGETESETETEGEKNEELEKEPEETCTCVAKCATCDKPLKSNDETAKKNEEEKETKMEAKKNKAVLPTVEVPEHLADNHLLKVIKQQIRILHAEMDNTDEESDEKGVSGGH